MARRRRVCRGILQTHATGMLQSARFELLSVIVRSTSIGADTDRMQNIGRILTKSLPCEILDLYQNMRPSFQDPSHWKGI